MPFLTKDELINIFGKDIIENKELLNTLLELAGLTEKKPFECVGTVSETRSALAYYLINNEPYGILIDYKNKVTLKDLANDFNNFEKLLNYHNEYNYIPEFL